MVNPSSKLNIDICLSKMCERRYIVCSFSKPSFCLWYLVFGDHETRGRILDHFMIPGFFAKNFSGQILHRLTLHRPQKYIAESGKYKLNQWLFLVPLKGGRWHIIPQLAVYTTYIPLIYCLLGVYMLPTTF